MLPTQAERDRMLTVAITAMRAYVECEPERSDWPRLRAEHQPVRSRLAREASKAVTAAVTTGGHIHTLITAGARCTGMRVVRMIDDRDAYARALTYERHAARRYLAEVTYALRQEAVPRARGGDRGVKVATAETLKISRVTLDKWLREDADGTAPQTPWEDMDVDAAVA